MNNPITPKQRMLNAYRGIPSDRPPVAPELWTYYPAKLLGVDMLQFEREVPFHMALKNAFEHFGCEGWGVTFFEVPAEGMRTSRTERWLDKDTLQVRTTIHTPHGDLQLGHQFSRHDPNSVIERPLKDLGRDLAAWEHASFGEIGAADFSSVCTAHRDVGESYLLECWLGVPFFDFWAGSREGGFETGVYDFADPELRPTLQRLQARYIDYLVRLTDAICRNTPFESLCIGCSWSCNSLIGPQLWRQWDKPVIKAVADAIHRHGKLLHVHFHGKCMETVADLAEIGIDCVCPFERPPGGDVVGIKGLEQVHRLLGGRTTMNGNVHTIETLIRGTPADVEREVDEILEAFAGEPRVIVGTGDQVGRETPEENLWAMVDRVKRLG